MTILSTFEATKGVHREKHPWIESSVLDTVAGLLLAQGQCTHGAGGRDRVRDRGRQSLGRNNVYLEQAAAAGLGGWPGVWHEPAGAS